MTRAAATDFSARRWARQLVCSRTGETGPLDVPAFLSPAGAPWLVDYELSRERGEELLSRLPGRPWTLWRYRELLPLRDFDNRVDLGEGGTPLVHLARGGPEGVEVWLKEESGNPTGSFKDRGLSLAVNRARELGAEGVQLPSAGNAAIAVSAYAAAAGLECRVAVPVDAPRAVIELCRGYGAEVLIVGDNLAESGLELGRQPGDFWDLSTLKEPYRAEGKKTMGLELAEQLGLLDSRRPRFVAVQMTGCAPIVRAFEQGLDHAPPWEDPESRVWGLRVPKAIGDFIILETLRETGGTALAIDESRIEDEGVELAREAGLLVGPEGAAAMLACRDLVENGTIGSGERVVVFQTGHPGNYE